MVFLKKRWLTVRTLQSICFLKHSSRSLYFIKGNKIKTTLCKKNVHVYILDHIKVSPQSSDKGIVNEKTVCGSKHYSSVHNLDIHVWMSQTISTGINWVIAINSYNLWNHWSHYQDISAYGATVSNCWVWVRRWWLATSKVILLKGKVLGVFQIEFAGGKDTC